VLVTASVVEPVTAQALPPSPGEFHTTPNDWELYLLGSIEGRGRVICGPEAARLENLGLNRLRGPGAWACYGSPARESGAPAPALAAPKPD
jgi:hypothetical protein